MRSALMNRRKLLQRRGELGNQYHHQPKPSPIHCRESLQIQPNEKVENKTAELLSSDKDQVRTITADRGKEFVNHQKVANALECDYCFAQSKVTLNRSPREPVKRTKGQLNRRGNTYRGVCWKVIGNKFCLSQLNRPVKPHNIF